MIKIKESDIKPYWKSIKVSSDNEKDVWSICFVNDMGMEIMTGIETTNEVCKQGLPCREDEIGGVVYLSGIYGIKSAVFFVANQRFGTAEQKVSSRYILAPDITECVFDGIDIDVKGKASMDIEGCENDVLKGVIKKFYNDPEIMKHYKSGGRGFDSIEHFIYSQAYFKELQDVQLGFISSGVLEDDGVPIELAVLEKDNFQIDEATSLLKGARNLKFLNDIYALPSAKDVESLKPGDVVKLCFSIVNSDNGSVFTEALEVVVVMEDAGIFVGMLDEPSTEETILDQGTLIRFHDIHIIKIIFIS